MNLADELERLGLEAARARTMPEWIAPRWQGGWQAHHERELLDVERWAEGGGVIHAAASQLMSIAQTAPEQGSLHHVAMIHADALFAIAAALRTTETGSTEGEG